jgi:hypothetical protein
MYFQICVGDCRADLLRNTKKSPLLCRATQRTGSKEGGILKGLIKGEACCLLCLENPVSQNLWAEGILDLHSRRPQAT